MSRGFRLTGGDEIREVVKLGLRTSNQHLTLHYMISEQPKFAIVVSRAVGGAVQRNLLKRRARSAIFEIMSVQPVGLNAVLRLRPGSAKASYAEFLTSISALIKKATQ
ncbi:ribonuclease P protein component [Candidatus Aquiluna sp. UB-MaderosW2red]|uniref:ribonuclease P protein component n=1 Tax=Candidatus Aquiluna sp. UB-MaderosW2red TaxID=1855377 RepID=UPI0012FC2D78|nr:ribonuclease P protein component [Candidatus Aquiluna sp. UB-MaderosW2red]